MSDIRNYIEIIEKASKPDSPAPDLPKSLSRNKNEEDCIYGDFRIGDAIAHRRMPDTVIGYLVDVMKVPENGHISSLSPAPDSVENILKCGLKIHPKTGLVYMRSFDMRHHLNENIETTIDMIMHGKQQRIWNEKIY